MACHNVDSVFFRFFSYNCLFGISMPSYFSVLQKSSVQAVSFLLIQLDGSLFSVNRTILYGPGLVRLLCKFLANFRVGSYLSSIRTTFCRHQDGAAGWGLSGCFTFTKYWRIADDINIKKLINQLITDVDEKINHNFVKEYHTNCSAKSFIW